MTGRALAEVGLAGLVALALAAAGLALAGQFCCFSHYQHGRSHRGGGGGG